MIKGIHHVSMKCRPEQLEKVRDFYCRMLGLPVCAEWETGFLLDTPAGKVEFFTNAQEDLPKGTIRHFAFEVDDVDAELERLKRFNPEPIRTKDDGKRVFFVKDPDGLPIEIRD